LLSTATDKGYSDVVAVLKERLAKLLTIRTARGTKLHFGQQAKDTILHVKADLQQYKAVDWLLKENADPNVRNSNEATPLLITSLQCSKVLTGTNHYIAMLLMNANADVNTMDVYDQTPLAAAMFCDNLEMMQILLKNKADPNFRDTDGMTPLHKAVNGGGINAIQLLQQSGADPTIKNNDGQTPLEIAKESGEQNKIDLFK